MSALSELFISIGIKAEGLQQLTDIHAKLTLIAGEARNAIKEIAALNNIQIAPNESQIAPNSRNRNRPNRNGYDTPIGPHQPVTPNPNGYDDPIGPHTPPITPNPNAYLDPIGPKQPDPAIKFKSQLTAVKQLSEGLNKMAIMLGAVAAATAVLIYKSITATMEMANFGLATGMSTDRLQEFQHMAQVAGASGKEMSGLLDSMQMKIQEVRVGEGDISPFALLGLDVSQNPMQMMDILRAKLAVMSDDQKQFARMLAARIGINSTMFASLLRQSKELSKSLVLDQGAITSTSELNYAWQDLVFSLSAVRNQIVSALAPTFTFLIGLLTSIIGKLSVFSQFLASSSIIAKVLSVFLALIAGLLFVLASAFAIAATAIIATTSVMGVMLFVSSGLAASIWGVVTAASAAAVPFVVLGALLAAIVLVWDEVITAFQGGNTVFGQFTDWAASLPWYLTAIVDPILAIMEVFEGLGEIASSVWDGIVNTISSAISAITSLIPSWLLKWMGGGSSVAVSPMQSITQAAAQPPSNQPNGKQSSNVSQDIAINVDGSKDPKETAKAVNNGLKAALGNASYQMAATAV